MNKQNEDVRASDEQVTKQAKMMLPFLSDEVPVLYLADGRAYIPVYTVCQVLGINAKRHIQKWQKLLLWVTARKLPCQTTHGKRHVWCLHLSQVPYLYSLFDWGLVSLERRGQLQKASEKGIELAWRAHQEILRQYRTIRRELFSFLTMSENIEGKLISYERHMSLKLEGETVVTLAELVGRGIVLYTEARAHAKTILQDQKDLPIIDLYTINEQDEAVEQSTMPLLPVINKEDQERLAEWLIEIAYWQLEMTNFCLKH